MGLAAGGFGFDATTGLTLGAFAVDDGVGRPVVVIAVDLFAVIDEEVGVSNSLGRGGRGRSLSLVLKLPNFPGSFFPEDPPDARRFPEEVFLTTLPSFSPSPFPSLSTPKTLLKFIDGTFLIMDEGVARRPFIEFFRVGGW